MKINSPWINVNFIIDSEDYEKLIKGEVVTKDVISVTSVYRIMFDSELLEKLNERNK